MTHPGPGRIVKNEASALGGKRKYVRRAGPGPGRRKQNSDGDSDVDVAPAMKKRKKRKVCILLSTLMLSC